MPIQNEDREKHRDERVRLMGNSAIHYAGMAASGVVGIALVPILLRSLGAERYGIWIIATATAALVGAFDFGLPLALTRDIAANLNGDNQQQTIAFAGAAARASLLLGCIGGLLIAAIGVKLSTTLHLAAADEHVARVVFALIGISFALDRLVGFSGAVLMGLQRFALMNLLYSATALVRGTGILALLWYGGRLVSLAIWNAVAALITVVVALIIVGLVEPRFRGFRGGLRWSSLRSHLSFGLYALAGNIVARLTWEVAPLLIGFVLGAASIVPFYIGQRFPLAIGDVSWRITEVVFPAASAVAGNREGSRRMLEFSTRWSLVVVLPLCLMLIVLAPNLLQAWVKAVPQQAALVLRLMAAAVAAETIGAGAYNVLLGQGGARRAFVLFAGAAVVSAILSLVFLHQVGITGPAVALLIAVTFTSLLLVQMVGHKHGISAWRLLGQESGSLVVPLLMSAGAAWGAAQIGHPERWRGVVAAAAIGGVAYIIALYLFGGREEERMFLKKLAKFPAFLIRQAYGRLNRRASMPG